MDVRSVTIGLNLEDIRNDSITGAISAFLSDIEDRFTGNNIMIRTRRINLIPLNTGFESFNEHTLLGILERASDICRQTGVRWINVPFDLVDSNDPAYDSIMETAFHIINRYPNSFVNFIVAKDNRINYQAILEASRFIKQVSGIGSHGYNNFRVGVSCNPRPDTPFFPFTYSSGSLGFSLALEMPKYFHEVISRNRDRGIAFIREQIIESIVPELVFFDRVSRELAGTHGLRYNGIDTSLAPFKEPGSSVAGLIELLGADIFGGNGTLFFTSYLTDILKIARRASNIRETGFGGVMYSLLEDPVMGKSNNLKTFSIDSLISYSCVCGCGLDMVPIPGDVFDEEIASIILDIAALSTTLDKPLGVRILPIPMKKEYELTAFDMDFICNTRIQKMKYCVSWHDIFKNRHFSYKAIESE